LNRANGILRRDERVSRIFLVSYVSKVLDANVRMMPLSVCFILRYKNDIDGSFDIEGLWLYQCFLKMLWEYS
jgi:hypothetical protein